MTVLVLIVTPVGQGQFAARLGDRIVVERTRQPLLDGARVLLGEGYDPDTPIVLRHAGRNDDALRSTIGAAAGLTVKEGPSRPVFARFETAPATPSDRAPVRSDRPDDRRQPRPTGRNGGAHP
jgi:hypothetical protein